MVSYDQCGDSQAAIELERQLQSHNPSRQNPIPECCREKAGALAADRATTLVPVICAQIIFISGYAVNYVKIFTAPPAVGNWWNLDIHSLAFSLTYLWVIVAVLLGSLIGVSQSEQAIARILHCLGDQGQCAITHGSLQRSEGFSNNPSPFHTLTRNGAIASWRPDKWKTYKLPIIADDVSETPKLSAKVYASKATPFLCVFSVVIVGMGTVSACILSGFVPLEGFGPRCLCHATLFTFLLISFLIQYIVARLNLKPQLHFWIISLKDLVFSSFHSTTQMLIIVGILNSCFTYTFWGMLPVVLINVKEVQEIMRGRHLVLYPTIIFVAISLHLIFCCLIAWWYRLALKVYLQRDDDRSYLPRIKQWPLARWVAGLWTRRKAQRVMQSNN